LQDGNEAGLALCEKPVGALAWQPNVVAPTNVQEAEVLNEGSDPQLLDHDLEEYTR
jgi:hypothetical protein